MSARPGRPRRPTFVFVDDEGWLCFDQAAAALRRRGARCVRVHGEKPPRRFDRMLYDETIPWSAPGSERLIELLSDGVSDVIFNEMTLSRIGPDSDLGLALISQSLAFASTPASALLDKYRVNELLGAAGIGVPRQLLGSAYTPSEAIAQLGLPLVVKTFVGAASHGVKIAKTAEEVVAAVESFGEDRSRLFYQEFVPGELLLYASVRNRNDVIMAHGFRVAETQYPQGPSATLRFADDPDLLAAGRRAINRLGPVGYSELGFIRSGDGRLFHFDANLRFSGMVCAPLRLGVDFPSAYAALMMGVPWTRSEPPLDPGADLPVLPYALRQAANQGSVADIARALWLVATSYAPTLGGRYAAVIILQAAKLLMRRWTAPRWGWGKVRA